MESYQIGIKRDFLSLHYLVGGDWGRENQPHPHHYVWELVCGGPQLDQHGYLTDLLILEEAADLVVARYASLLLNDLTPFQGVNPSLERFCRVLGGEFLEELPPNLRPPSFVSRLWENETAWASWVFNDE